MFENVRGRLEMWLEYAPTVGRHYLHMFKKHGNDITIIKDIVFETFDINDEPEVDIGSYSIRHALPFTKDELVLIMNMLWNHGIRPDTATYDPPNEEVVKAKDAHIKSLEKVVDHYLKKEDKKGPYLLPYNDRIMTEFNASANSKDYE